MKETQLQISLPGVPLAKQGREVAPPWAWTQASVWTERMLATLERGILGGKWYSLIDKVWKRETWRVRSEKWPKAKARKSPTEEGADAMPSKATNGCHPLQDKLKSGQYQPEPAQRVWIPKLGSKELRPLGIPPVENRVVEMALRHVLEPIFEHDFAKHSCGFRPGHGAKQALREVQAQLRQGKVWVVDADIKGYFDNIPQDKLLARVAEPISDGAVLELIQRFLQQGVMESGKGWKPTNEGTPQGSVLSPLLANIYLNPLDHQMAQAGHQMVRYADDFVILCESQETAQSVLEEVRQWMGQAGLTLHPTKTRIVNASACGGFDFLGYHFERGHRWPRKKSLDKLKDTLRQKTPRLRPDSLRQIVTEINRTLDGWFEYFKHRSPERLSQLGWMDTATAAELLRKRHKGKGRARGRDHQRWRNAYFADLGLISLALAHRQAANSR